MSKQTKEVELASPVVSNGDFRQWLKHTCYAAWVTEELGRNAATREDQMWCMSRMAEIDKERGPNRV